ncbi:hypothetical protein J7E91_31665 [Streptomyces sp. ISL-99]|uniref:hypothetical protein n=1 Tax=Streptomyces sp. ISL-99 TaxID=2819193 RepID=UPI001BE86855|nr:hypothetical protein [Streptomyces sp. ISL-99]MBT2529811.1 hypothetical protein [Streptomyces sp. ISL-99]
MAVIRVSMRSLVCHKDDGGYAGACPIVGIEADGDLVAAELLRDTAEAVAALRAQFATIVGHAPAKEFPEV